MAPFIEHFPIKKIYYKATKDKDEMIFSHRVSFCNSRLDSSILNIIKNILEKKYIENKTVGDKYY